jgi:hypothetical protein
VYLIYKLGTYLVCIPKYHHAARHCSKTKHLLVCALVSKTASTWYKLNYIMWDYGRCECSLSCIWQKWQIFAMVLRMEMLCFLRIMCSKYEWNSECVWASRRSANTNESQLECWWATQKWGQVTGYAGENVFSETDFINRCTMWSVCKVWFVST